jgi:hypothetical protein
MGSYGGSGFGPYAGGGLITGLVVGACVVILGLFIWSGLVHLVLMLLGGATFGYEATLRTIAYAQGSAAPLGVIPFCGGLISGLWGLVAAVIGLAEMQEISIGKSAAAILIPVIVCCFVAFLAFSAAFLAMLGLAAANS